MVCFNRGISEKVWKGCNKFTEMKLFSTLPRPHFQLYPPIKTSYNVKLSVINSSAGHKVFSVYNTENFNTAGRIWGIIQRMHRNSWGLLRETLYSASTLSNRLSPSVAIFQLSSL